jgi:hypothetical protein
MLIDNGAAFMEAIRPARARIRGVFFGHIHRAYQVMHDGILLSSAPSGFAQLQSWPEQDRPMPAPWEPAGLCVVTITERGTIVRQIGLPREAGTKP